MNPCLAALCGLLFFLATWAAGEAIVSLLGGLTKPKNPLDLTEDEALVLKAIRRIEQRKREGEIPPGGI